MNGKAIADALGFKSARQFSLELLILATVAVAAALWGAYQLRQFDFLRVCQGFDLWFDSDPARTVANITSRWVSFHQRTGLHPLYSLWIAAPFGFLGDGLSLKTSTVTLIYVALQSACLSSAVYIAARAFGLVRLDAVLTLLLFNSTAAAIYWIGFPEWLALGAASAVVSAIWIASPSALQNELTGAAQNLISASMVTTNWAIGMAASLVSGWPKLSWSRLLVHTRDALAIMAAMTVIQYALFPQAGGFLNIWSVAGGFVDGGRASRSVLDHVIEFFGQALAAPNMSVREGPRTIPGWGALIMSSQHQAVAVTPLTLTIFALWIGQWALGILAALRGGVTRPVLVLVCGAIVYFFMLHAVLGGEIFLFSLVVAPWLTFVAAWAMTGRRKLIARGVCVALILASFSYNYPRFQSAVAIHNSIDASWLAREFSASDEARQTDCR